MGATVDGKPFDDWRRFWHGEAEEAEARAEAEARGEVPSPPVYRARPAHADYPHHHGYLMGCPGCEARCHCRPGNAECVFDGYHREWCRTCEEATLDDGEGWDGECGNCADRTYAAEGGGHGQPDDCQ